MKEEKNEQTEFSAQVTEVTKSDGEGENPVSLGKFKDVSALLSAYNSLEAEFTKRCQRIKELESEKRNDDKATTVAPQSSVAENEGNNLTEKDKEEILKGYLKDVMDNMSKAIVMDGQGVSVKTPSLKPRTVEEAGRLAKELLEKK